MEQRDIRDLTRNQLLWLIAPAPHIVRNKLHRPALGGFPTKTNRRAGFDHLRNLAQVTLGPAAMGNAPSVISDQLQSFHIVLGVIVILVANTGHQSHPAIFDHWHANHALQLRMARRQALLALCCGVIINDDRLAQANRIPPDSGFFHGIMSGKHGMTIVRQRFARPTHKFDLVLVFMHKMQKGNPALGQPFSNIQGVLQEIVFLSGFRL